MASFIPFDNDFKIEISNCRLTIFCYGVLIKQVVLFDDYVFFLFFVCFLLWLDFWESRVSFEWTETENNKKGGQTIVLFNTGRHLLHLRVTQFGA
jgi:hypothetical protein